MLVIEGGWERVTEVSTWIRNRTGFEKCNLKDHIVLDFEITSCNGNVIDVRNYAWKIRNILETNYINNIKI